MNDNTDKNKKLRDLYEQVMLPNYAPADFIPEKASGSSVWDKNNKKFIDFGGGIAVNSLGHSHPKLVSALNEQSKKLWHLSNYISNEPAINLAKQLTDLTFADKVYFSNSGSEANEAAIKMARRYHHEKGNGRDEIIAFNNSFHGRSLLNISLGASDNHRKGFGPFPAGIRHATYNDLSSVKALITAKTAAIIIEPVQGEGGVNDAGSDFLQGLRKLCDEKGLLLILDEIQTGLGRTGEWFGFHHAGIKPDIVTVAKGIANGVPIGAVWAKLEVANAFQPGDHGSTFAGQPLAASAARETLRVLEEIKAPKLAKEKGAEMVSVITNIDGVNSVRGLGLLLGVEIEKDRLIHGDARDLAQACLREGLVVNGVTPTALRLAPPLTISSEEIIEGAGILEKVLKTRKEDAL